MSTKPRPKITPDKNYQQTMVTLRSHLPHSEQLFSRFIHIPLVDSVSEALGRTIARPSVLLGGLTGALITNGSFYIVAREYGFRISGSELLIGLAAGAFAGLVIEFVWRLGHQSKRTTR